MQQVIEITHNQLEDTIDKVSRKNRPLFLWGTTGIGKSATIKRKAKEQAEERGLEFAEWNELSADKKHEVVENPEEYYIFVDVRLAEYEPSDIKGIPNLEANGAVEWKPPLWVYAISQEGMTGMVFLDEANLAAPSVQKAFYQLILDGQVGEYSVSDGVYMMAAGNRAEDRANVYEMAAPLRNRFLHAQLRVPGGGEQGDVTRYAIENGWGERVISYIASNMGRDKVFMFNDENRDATVFATPRAWEFVSDLIEGVEDLREVERLTAMAVGEGVATEFRGFLELRRNVDLQDYIENPEKVKELDKQTVEGDMTTMDLKHSILTGIASEYNQNTDLLEELVEIAYHLDTEFGTLLLKLAKTYHPQHFTKNVVDIDRFDELSEDYAKYLLD